MLDTYCGYEGWPSILCMEGVSAKAGSVAFYIGGIMKIIFLLEDTDPRTELRTKVNPKRTCCEWFDFSPTFLLNCGNCYH